MRWQRIFLVVCLLLTGAAAARADDPFVVQPLRILLPGDLGTLEALLVRPSDPGRYPLALIAHGSPRSGAERPEMTPLAMLPQALEFARRGWAAVVVMRRGYGSSDGGWAESFGPCADPNYAAAGTAAAADLKAAVSFLSRRPDIDASRVLGVGVSAGGFASVALTADPPAGLVAAISFAGGRGSLQDGQDCQASKLVEAYRVFGKTARVPMLWVYAANDHFFGPELAQELRTAYTDGSGKVDFISAPAFGSDGHGLFSPTGIPVWSAYVDKFLARQNLVMRKTLLPVPRATLTAPAILSTNGREAFETYLVNGPHKAFAVAADGHFGWKTGARTAEVAKAGALNFCQQSGRSCQVLFVDDAALPVR